ncbi:MAG: hypothetical protein M0010_02740 [Actinomycetota bacterium]|nr:hypothetical protein [Actinomycetota bacterium]
MNAHRKREEVLAAIFETPQYLPIAWSFAPATLDGKEAVVGVLRTPAYVVRPVFLRQGALACAKELIRAARGPLQVPELVVPELVVPGENPCR